MSLLPYVFFLLSAHCNCSYNTAINLLQCERSQEVVAGGRKMVCSLNRVKFS